jgi:hypothetical protein
MAPDLEDIEDLKPEHVDAGRAGTLSLALNRVQRSGSRNTPESSSSDALVPGTQAIWVKTFGCSHNISDSEYIMGQLQDYGYR